MRTTVRGLRRWLNETLVEKRHVEREPKSNSLLGVKDKSVHVKAGSKLADRIEPELVDMVSTSYAPVGGNPYIQAPGDISAEYPDWIVIDTDDDPEPDVFVGGSPRSGTMKLGVTATDGSPVAKSRLTQLKKKLFHNGWWAEVSDAPAHIALNKLHIKPIEDEHKVRSLLAGKKITWYGDHPEGKFPGTHGWYVRDIGGSPHAKIIVGDV